MKNVLNVAMVLLIFSTPVMSQDFTYLDCNTSLNMRSGVGTEHERVGSIPCGGVLMPTKVLVLERKDGWVQVYHDNKRAWVSGKYLENSLETSTPQREESFEKELVAREEIPKEWVDHEISRIDEYINSDLDQEGLGVGINSEVENESITSWPGDVKVYEIDNLGYKD